MIAFLVVLLGLTFSNGLMLSKAFPVLSVKKRIGFSAENPLYGLDSVVEILFYTLLKNQRDLKNFTDE